MWHVSSRSGVATLQTAIHLLLTYLHLQTEQVVFRSPMQCPCVTDSVYISEFFLYIARFYSQTRLRG